MKKELEGLNVFERIEKLKEFFDLNLGEKTYDEIGRILQKLSNYRYQIATKLTDEEARFNDLLIANDLKAPTLLGYWRLRNVDEELREMIILKKTSLKKATKVCIERSYDTNDILGQEIKNEILDYVKKLNYEDS